HEPHGAGRPPHRFAGVDAQVLAVLLTGGGARVGVHGHVELLADGPHRVVGRVVVGRPRPPHGRDQDAAPQAVLAGPADLVHGGAHVVADGHQGDAGPALGAVRAQTGQPAVVGPGP